MQKLKLKWVSDIIGDEYKQWQKGDMVVIDCQTGTGKSNFIKKVLLPHAKNNNKNILYLCNRVNLKRQVKLEIADLQKIKLSEDALKDIDELEQIGNCTIITYHKVQNHVLRQKYEKVFHELIDCHYDYIVLDECQYISHDSSFVNKTTFFYNDYLQKVNKDSAMIYMSATMDEVKPYIDKFYSAQGYEHKTWKYETGRDYSYIMPYYFSDIEDIINTINNDISGSKWLIFINSISEAKGYKSKINDCKFICSQNNKEADEMDKGIVKEIIETGQFSCKCVIATKAFDNGLNFTDPLLTNIVIITFNKIDFIQMLGRKRVNIDNPQKVKLYIPAKSKKSFDTVLEKQLNPQEDLVREYYQDNTDFRIKYDTSHKKLPENIFYQGINSGWQINDLGYDILLRQIDFCNYMVARFKTSKLAYILEQLSWIGLKYKSKNWITNVIDNNTIQTLEEYLESLINKQLFDTEQQELKKFISKDFEQMIIKLQGRHTDREAGMKVINKLFEACDLKYYISSSQEKSKKSENYNKYYWQIKKPEVSIAI